MLLKSVNNCLSPTEGYELHLYCHAAGCSKFGQFGGPTKGWAWRDAREAGWVKRRDGVVVCGIHKRCRFTGREG